MPAKKAQSARKSTSTDASTDITLEPRKATEIVPGVYITLHRDHPTTATVTVIAQCTDEYQPAHGAASRPDQCGTCGGGRQ